MGLPEEHNKDIVVALCRFRGLQNDRYSERAEENDLSSIGKVFDHAEEGWQQDFIVWLLGLAKQDLETAAVEYHVPVAELVDAPA